MEREFDVVVIGSGPAGEVAAGRLAKRGGKRVAIVERSLVGGECAYFACMPAKALLRPAEVLREVARIPGAADAVTGELDVDAALARRDEVIHDLSDESQMPWLERLGIELFRGSARLDGERRVIVGDGLLRAREAVVLAVGSTAAFPPIPGLAEAAAWSNRELTTAKAAPGRLLILGGGVVGVEMAQAWRSLGSRVTLIEAADRLVAREEPVAGDEVRAALERDGVEVRTGVAVAEVRHDGASIVVGIEGGDSVAGDQLLVAVGRKPLSSDLGLESVGLNGGGYVEVDDRLRAGGLPWLYAVGDVNGRSLLTHAGKYQARIATDNILGEDSVAWADDDRVPRVVFTDPQIAAVGLTLEAARKAGIDAEAIDVPTSSTAGASFYGRGADGTSRFVVDREREVLAGVTFVGADVTDMLHAATIAVVGELPLSMLAHAIASFPTRTELWLKFLEEYERRSEKSLHTRRAAGG